MTPSADAIVATAARGHLGRRPRRCGVARRAAHPRRGRGGGPPARRRRARAVRHQQLGADAGRAAPAAGALRHHGRRRRPAALGRRGGRPARARHDRGRAGRATASSRRWPPAASRWCPRGRPTPSWSAWTRDLHLRAPGPGRRPPCAAGARLVGTNEDATYPTPDGLVPGAGAILAAVVTAAGAHARGGGQAPPADGRRHRGPGAGRRAPGHGGGPPVDRRRPGRPAGHPLRPGPLGGDHAGRRPGRMPDARPPRPPDLLAPGPSQALDGRLAEQSACSS